LQDVSKLMFSTLY